MIGNLLGWLVVIGIGVPVSIALHELGHLLPAKKFGVACPQYFIGFGPTLWSTRRGGTEYGIKAIPLGGYVRMLGMFPPVAGRPVRADSTGRVGMLIESARADAQREIGPRDADRLFYQRSVPKRLVIMLGGPTMNLITALVLLTGLLTLHGMAVLTPTVDRVSQCVISVSSDASAADRECTASDPASPAAEAGLRPGDVIVGFEGAAVTDWTQVRDRIRANTGTPVQIEVERGGQRLQLTATPMVDTRYLLDDNGQPVKGDDGRYLTTRVGFLGVTPQSRVERQSLAVVPGIIGDGLVRTGQAMLGIPQKMVGVVKAAFGQGERDPEGPLSIVGVGRIAGEAGAVQGTADAPVTWTDKFAYWVQLIASLNLALFVFNLIPLLPLDGGHVAGALWEGLRRRVARLAGRPDPGPVDIAKALPLAYAVGSTVLVMSVLLIYADIVNPIRLGG